MKKNCLFLMVLLCVSSNPGFSQSLDRMLVSSSGGSNVIGNQSISFSVGEVVISTISNPDWRVTQGFQQPGDCPTNTSHIINKKTEIIIYPNPVSEFLYVKYIGEQEELQTSSIRLFNLKGAVVLNKEIAYCSKNPVVEIDCSVNIN